MSALMMAFKKKMLMIALCTQYMVQVRIMHVTL